MKKVKGLRPAWARNKLIVAMGLTQYINVLSLFANGEQGWWFDNSDLTTMFQDSAGTTPVTGENQSVGLQLDKRFGLVLNANQAGTIDGTWSKDASVSISNGEASFSSTPASANGLFKNISIQSGKTYKVTFTVSGYVSGNITAWIGGAQSVTTNPVFTGNGTFSFYTSASSGANGNIIVGTRTTVGTFILSNLSVRELPGNHRFQTAAASRPILRRNATTGAYYLETDGVDDGMLTNSVDFTGTNKVSLFTGARKLSDAAVSVLAELSNVSSTSDGSFGVFAPLVATQPRFVFRSRGTVTVDNSSPNNYAAPFSAVISGLASIQTDFNQLRLNGVALTTAADQGTGNYGNYPAYFFRRANSSLPFNGHEYQSICVGRLCTDSEIRGIERLIARSMGVTLA